MDMPDVEIVPAPSELRPFLRRYMYANQRLQSPLIVRPKPTGYNYFSNLFGDACADYFLVDGERMPRRSRWVFAGQIVDHAIEVHHPERHEALYCELAATGLYRLFGVPGAEITGRAPPLADFGGELDALARRHLVLGAEATRDEHVAEANSFFLALADRGAPSESLVDDAVLLFEAANGAVRVVDVCKELGVQQRRLDRLFSHIVGVSPKFFGQILQINWVVGLLYSNNTATLAEIAHEAGYYDQSHFHRAMRRFFNEGPREFLQSDHVLFKAFLGQSRRFGPSAELD
jgi:AraC-like DNA-binding protein